MERARRVRSRGSCSSAGRRTKRDTRQMTEERHDDPSLSPAPVCHTETNHYGGITRGPFGGGVFWGCRRRCMGWQGARPEASLCRVLRQCNWRWNARLCLAPHMGVGHGESSTLFLASSPPDSARKLCMSGSAQCSVARCLRCCISSQ